MVICVAYNGIFCYTFGNIFAVLVNLMKVVFIISDLGSRIKGLRKEKKMSQGDLALLCSTTSAAISRYENGKRIPRSDTVARIARALDTSVDYLLDSTLHADGGEDNVRLSSAMQIIGMAQKQNEITPKQALVLQEITREVFGDFGS